jgi:hypothetical protein
VTFAKQRCNEKKLNTVQRYHDTRGREMDTSSDRGKPVWLEGERESAEQRRKRRIVQTWVREERERAGKEKKSAKRESSAVNKQRDDKPVGADFQQHRNRPEWEKGKKLRLVRNFAEDATGGPAHHRR